MWTRRQLKDKARQVLDRSYWKMVLVSVIVTFLMGAIPSINLNLGTEGLPISINGNKLYWDGDQDYFDFEVVIDEDGGIREVVATLEKGLANWKNGWKYGGTAVRIMQVIVVLIVVAITLALGSGIFLANPLLMGARYFFYRSLKEEEKIKALLRAFSDRYLHIVKTLFLADLYIALWSLLFVIPGIIKGYQYRMVPYILAEHPDMSTRDVLEFSKDMMRGQKWKAFVLDLSFLGWNILGGFTLGILNVFYVAPYQNLTNAALYEALRYRSNYEQLHSINCG